jgi:hypothetical protein
MDIPVPVEYVLLIMNCKQYQWKAERQRATWIKKVFSDRELSKKMVFYHVIGDPALKEEYTIDHSSNVLTIKVDDDYNSLPKKVIRGYKAIMAEYPNLKYVFKTDDDQELKNEQFFRMLLQILSKKKPFLYYGGNIINVSQGYISKYHTIHPELPEDLKVYPGMYCSGRFYFLNIVAIKHITSETKMALIEKEYLEDYAIGQHMDPEYKVDWRIHHIPTDLFFNDFI